ncbi:MAG: FHA domain-containing protein [Calditrichaeota bacterium]|nr:MAG: FHA domain-containing protein [Calditrichota bacterium]
MAQLCLKNRAETIEVFQLEELPSIITIGSDPANTIIVQDPRVSSTHLEIQQRADGCYLCNKSGVSATFLNYRRLEASTLLTDGDEIIAGDHLFIFTTQGSDASMPKNKAAGVEQVNTASGEADKSNNEQSHTSAPSLYEGIAAGQKEHRPDQEPSLPLELDRTIALTDRSFPEVGDHQPLSESMQHTEDDEEHTIAVFPAATTEDIGPSEPAHPPEDEQEDDDRTVISHGQAEATNQDRTVAEIKKPVVPLMQDPSEASQIPWGDALESNSPDVLDEQVIENGGLPERKNNLRMDDHPTHQLLTIYGPYRGERHSLRSGKTRIGRETAGNDIVLNKRPNGELDSTISRRHAAVIERHGKYFLCDPKSKLRTYLNQREITPEEELELTEGDEIEIVSGYTSTIFRFVRSGVIDFSPPRRAGVWRVHYRRQIEAGMLAFLFILATTLLVIGAKRIPSMFDKERAVQYKAEVINRYKTVNVIKDSLARTPTPVAGDFDADGNLEIAFINDIGEIVCFTLETKTEKWRISEDDHAKFQHSLTIEDLEGDGDLEIVAAAENSLIYAVNSANGAIEWKSNPLGGDIVNQVTVADLTANSRKEIIAFTDDNTLVIGFPFAATYRWSKFPQEFSSKGITTAGDIDGDGVQEIIIGSQDGGIYIFSLASNQVKTKSMIDVNSEISKAFEDGDTGYHEINNSILLLTSNDMSATKQIVIAATRMYRVLAFDTKNFHRLWADRFYKSRIGMFPLYHSSPIAADLNHDGQWEVIMAGYRGLNMIKVFSVSGDSSGHGKLVWQLNSDDEDAFISTPTLSDINLDGITDIIAAGVSGNVYFLDGKAGKLIDSYKAAGTSFTASPLVCSMANGSRLCVVVLADDYSLHLLNFDRKNITDGEYWNQFLGAADHRGLYTAGSNRSIPSISHAKSGSTLFSLMVGLILFIISGGYLLRQKREISKMEMRYR